MAGITEELFDIYDDNGQAMGTAPRAEVHARGYWHHTFHCWLVRIDEAGHARILFQRRSDAKDTNPGRFDITVAGHLSSGETVSDAVREIEEELGLSVPFEALVPFGTIREEMSGEVRGRRYIDREVSHVFGMVTNCRLEGFRLQEEEVAGLYEADARQLIALFEGGVREVEAAGVRLLDGVAFADRIAVRVSDFVPRDAGYYRDVFGFLLRLGA